MLTHRSLFTAVQTIFYSYTDQKITVHSFQAENRHTFATVVHQKHKLQRVNFKLLSSDCLDLVKVSQHKYTYRMDEGAILGKIHTTVQTHLASPYAIFLFAIQFLPKLHPIRMIIYTN